MAFNSSILSENANNISSKTEFMHSNDTFYDALLEYNDRLHDLDIDDKLSYYHGLANATSLQESSKELALLNESYLKTAWEKLTKILETVIDFIKKALKSFKNDKFYHTDTVTYKNYLKQDPRLSKNSWINKNPDEERNVMIYHYPNLNDIKIDVVPDLKLMQIALKAILTDSIGKKLDIRSEEDIYKSMAKILSKAANNKRSDAIDIDDVKDTSTFSRYVNERIIYVEHVSLNAADYLSYFDSLQTKIIESSEYAKKIDAVEKIINESKALLINYKNSVTEENYNKASEIVNKIKNIGTSYTTLIMKISKAQADEIKYNNTFYKNVFIFPPRENVSESGYIHGEEFDSDTLFANADMRDFNPTEWLDLSLTTGIYEMKFAMMDTFKRIAIQEALIFADNDPLKFNRLVAMREAEESKAKITIEKIIEFLKKQMDNLMNKAKDRTSENTKYIRDNMETINKPITIEEAISHGDILAGMYRVQKGINIEPFNYDTMKDQLKDKETFFKARIISQLANTSSYAKRNVKWQDGMSITEFCKAYYGASMPEDKYPVCKFTTGDLEANKKNITDFLQNTNYFSAKNDLTALENEGKKASAKLASNAEAKAPAENKPAEGGEQQNNTEGKQESMYFSNLYNRYFNEIELNMGETPENQNGAENGANENSAEGTALRVYMECYKDVILAKMTASEFISSELMQLIKAHVRKYNGPGEKAPKQPKQQHAPQQNK